MLKTFIFNPYQQCTYIFSAQEESEPERSCIVIDAGMGDAEEQSTFSEYLLTHHLRITAILVTHFHPDHICGLSWLRQTFPEAQVYSAINLADGQHLQLAGLDIEVMATPGHKEDCLCFYIPSQKLIFTGDTLFRNSVGRTDLSGGSWNTLMQSLQRLISLPDETSVYPGHGMPTTISHEKKYNPYLYS